MPANVLVVEDDPDLLDNIVQLLSLEGYATLAARNGQAALQLLQTLTPPPACLVLDLMMPVTDGYQVWAELRGEARTRDVPVVVLTAVALDETRERVESAGASMFLTKPFEPDDLSRALASMIHRAGDR